ncbi:MAG: TIM barrel protein [archaeon]
MKNIKFGPAGLGSVKEAIFRLEEYHKIGLTACEIAFTYGVYIKNKDDAIAIGKAAKKFKISLSIHAPYWINLNSYEKEKVQKSKERILSCLKVGTWLKATRIVFHPGYYGKSEKQETYKKIKREILELQAIKKEKKYTPKLAPETTGKINVFGSIEEIAQLVKDTKCSFCVDFAHILAREKSYCFARAKKAFPSKEWHVHFSGIEYGEKGEKHHKATKESEIKKLLDNLPKNKNITIINEAPDPIEDSVKSLNIHKKQ